jgi:hypothetical protein
MRAELDPDVDLAERLRRFTVIIQVGYHLKWRRKASVAFKYGEMASLGREFGLTKKEIARCVVTAIDRAQRIAVGRPACWTGAKERPCLMQKAA